MRALLLIAGAALALGGCGKNSQSDTTQNADDNLTAASIVSNDVTAIDAVTGDAANMAADVDMNFAGLQEANGISNESGARHARSAAESNSAAPQANLTANAVGNAQ